MAFCMNCGSPIKDNISFCGACGAPVENYCHKCGFKLEKQDKFCIKCGTPANSQSSCSNQQENVESKSDELKNKSLDELKALARSGNIDAAFAVGKYYAIDVSKPGEADKWFSLTYSGDEVHIYGLIFSHMLKRYFFDNEVDGLYSGFSDYTVDEFNKTINPYIIPAKIICELWQKNNRAFDVENYNDAMAFLAEINFYLGRVLVSNEDLNSKRNARNCFSACACSKYISENIRVLANLGCFTCDMILDTSRSSATKTAYNAYNYFSRFSGQINNDLNLAEQYIIGLFGTILQEYIENSSQLVIPYLKAEGLKKAYLKVNSPIQNSPIQINGDENSLLYQLELCAEGLYQLEQNNHRLSELKGKIVKSQDVKNEIFQLESTNSQISNQIAPFLKTYIPQEYWLATKIARMRDFVRGGHVTTLQEALSMLRMEDQAEHDRFMELAVRAEEWRRRH